MNKFLNDIRGTENPIPVKNKIINTTIILFLGIALGTFSKYLDFRQAELPGMIMAIDGALDIHNFLGRFAIWVLIALCISIFSKKLCADLVWIYSCFSIIGFCLLVCKGEKQTGIYTVGSDFGSIVQYVLCIWIRIF